MSARASRLDVELVARGLARSRTHAQGLIARGAVRVAGVGRVKASTLVSPGARIVVDDGDRVVGRGAHKLAGALDVFGPSGLDVSGRVAFDAGASTGGFTQVLLERGARLVYAVDVGHGQLDPRLAADPRVRNHEGVNLRFLSRDTLTLDPRPDMVVGDLSFISLTLVLPPLVATLAARDYVLLVKPQFEVGRERLGRGGVVTDPGLRREAVEGVVACARGLGLSVRGEAPSALAGSGGNQEHLLWLSP